MNTPSSPATPVAAPPASAAKPRSAVEKNIVRGGILLLVLLAAVQAHARFGYSLTLQKLQSRLSDDDTPTGQALKISELPQFVVGWPMRTETLKGKWGYVVYSWRGLTDTYEIRMPFDSTDEPPVVLGLETADAPPEPVASAMPGSDASGSPPEAGMGGMAGVTPGGPAREGGGGGGGGQRPDIMASDADGDGKVSLEEAPERMKQFFDRMDENKDGFIDAEEAAAARRRRAEREAGSGANSDSGAEGRPRPAETQPPTPDAPEKPAAPAEKPTEATEPANDKP